MGISEGYQGVQVTDLVLHRMLAFGSLVLHMFTGDKLMMECMMGKGHKEREYPLKFNSYLDRPSLCIRLELWIGKENMH